MCTKRIVLKYFMTVVSAGQDRIGMSLENDTPSGIDGC